MNILRGDAAKSAFGCDFVVQLSGGADRKIKILQLTDMQIIDSSQRRTPDRIRADEIAAWDPSKFDINFGDHVRSLVAQTKPDLIFLTGDMVYGSFDDSGRVFEWFCNFMDSLSIPWAPVFGNHDNESARGVDWQCEMFEKAEYALFKRGEVSGNGNYSVGICIGDTLVRVLYMLDSQGCLAERGLRADQLEWMQESACRAKACTGTDVPGFAAFHIPTLEFHDADIDKGYITPERNTFMLGVDAEAKDGDFGSNLENVKREHMNDVPGFLDALNASNIEAVFAGHFHRINTCITYKNIRWVHGLKTGQYDYHTPGQLGGTLITLEGGAFFVSHVPALVNCAPYPGKARIFNGFFVEAN